MLPEGVTTADVWAVLIPVGIVTLALRWIPFGATTRLRDSPIIEHLGATMPLGVMVILVAYTFLGQSQANGGLLAAGIAVIVTIGVHMWRGSAGLSIIAGTGLYILLVNLVF